MRLPLTEIAAWSGTLVSHRVPPTGFSTTGVSSRGPAPRVNSRRSISWPGRTTDNVCLPCAAFSEHGVEHAMDGLPSRVAVAPAGLLVNITSRGPPGRTGAGRSDWGVGGSGASGLTASLGDGLAGSAVDFHQAIGRNIHKLGQVNCPIGGGHTLDKNGRAVIAILVYVREEHARVGSATLRRENQPAAIRGPAMPGVHGTHVGIEPARLATTEGNNVKLTVGAHHFAIVRLNKDDPPAVGRHLGEGVAHPVPRSTGNGLSRTAATVVEWNAVKVILNWNFVRVVGTRCDWSSLRIGIRCSCARKDNGLAIRGPNSVGLHIVRVVCTGQRMTSTGAAVVPEQHATGGIENLKESIVLEVGDVVLVLLHAVGAAKRSEEQT